MSVREFARRAEISLSLAYLLLEQGRVPHRRIGAVGKRGKIVVREEDFLAFIESTKVDATLTRN